MRSTFRMLAAALVACLCGCGSSVPLDAAVPPAQGPLPSLPPVMHCAPEPGAATVAGGHCVRGETEPRA